MEGYFVYKTHKVMIIIIAKIGHSLKVVTDLRFAHPHMRTSDQP